MTLAACAAILALLPGCGSEPAAPEPETETARRPPQPACDQARNELERRERSGGFLFEDDGEAMTDRTAWMRMKQSARSELIGKLAVVAACTSTTPQGEVEVTIRDEGGMVLQSERVRPSTDFRAR